MRCIVYTRGVCRTSTGRNKGLLSYSNLSVFNTAKLLSRQESLKVKSINNLDFKTSLGHILYTANYQVNARTFGHLIIMLGHPL